MEKDFYYDTSVWLDLHEKRGKNGEFALKLILKIIEKDLKIAYSDLNIKEFKSLGYIKDNINSIMNIAKPENIKHIHINRNQIEEAIKLSRKRNVPKKDALHAVIARDNDLQLIATDPHFEKLKDISFAKRPEEFI